MTEKKIHYVIPFNKRVRTVSYVVVGTALAIGLFIFASDFVVEGSFIIRGGSVTVKSTAVGTQILIDSKIRGKVKEDGTLTIKRVSRGTHTFIATRAGDWPWIKEIVIKTGEEKLIIPLLIPQEVIGKIVENVPATLNFNNTQIKPNDQGTSSVIWAENTSIYVRSTSTKPIAIFTAEYPIRSLTLYPGRTDTLLIAAGKIVFALDIKKNKARNFLPIYKSTAPTFAIGSESGTIFIKDGENILELQL